jgi:thioredoxin-dependent peroxiredoxin
VILGISFDTPEENKAFKEAQGFPYPLLSDVDKSVGETYGAKRGPDEQWGDFAKRLTFLIGPDGVVRRVYDVHDVGTHPETVLADILSGAAH